MARLAPLERPATEVDRVADQSGLGPSDINPRNIVYEPLGMNSERDTMCHKNFREAFDAHKGKFTKATARAFDEALIESNFEKHCSKSDHYLASPVRMK